MEFIGREGNPLPNLFAEGKHAGNDFVYSGLYQNNHTEYRKSMANIINAIMKKDATAKEELKNFLRSSKYRVRGNAVYSMEEVANWLRPFKVYGSAEKVRFHRKKENDIIEIEELGVAGVKDMDSHSGLVFLRIIGYEDQPLSEKKKWELRKKIIDIWQRHGESKEYLEKVSEFLRIFEEGVSEDARFKYLSKLFYYLMPVDFEKFLNATIVSRASVFFRRKETRENFWEKTYENMDDFVKKSLDVKLKQTGKKLEDLRELVELSLSQEHLDSLRQDWKKMLKKFVKGESTQVSAVFMGNPRKTGRWFSYGEVILPVKEIELVCYMESDFHVKPELRASKILRGVVSNLKLSGYMGGIKISLDRENPFRPLDSLFGVPGFCEKYLKQKIRPKENGVYASKDSEEIVYALMHFAVELSKLARENVNSDRLKALLLVLDVEENADEEEKGKYPLWNEISALYEAYGFPVQTITRKFFKSYLSSPPATAKNMLLSLLKGIKRVRFNFGGFHLPERLLIFAVLEKPSLQVNYSRRDMDANGQKHCIYDVYRIEVNGSTAEVSLENRYFTFADGSLGDAVRLENWVAEQVRSPEVRLFFISTLKESPLHQLQEKLSSIHPETRNIVSIRYAELKTAHLVKGAQKSCYMIYTPELNKLLERLGIGPEKDFAAVALKPAPPPAPYDSEFYHTALQIFYTQKVGWLSDDMYGKEKDMLLFVLIALSNYESDSFSTPYAKLSIQSTERTRYFKFNRDSKDYVMPIRPMVYELVYEVLPLPGLRESPQTS